MKKTVVRLIFLAFLFILFLGVTSFFQKTRVTLDYEIAGTETVQLYWKVKKFLPGSGGYLEKRSTTRRLSPHIQKKDFFIPSLFRIDTLRIDPTKKETKITIHSITVKGIGYEPIVINKKEQWENIIASHDINFLQVEDGRLVIASTGLDSQFELNVKGTFHVFRFVSESLQENYRIITERMDLLGISAVPLFFLCLDILIILSFSATFLRGMKGISLKAGELSLAFGLIALSFTVLTTILIGTVYLLSWRNLIYIHLLAWVVLQIVQQKSKLHRIVFVAAYDLKVILTSILAPIKNILIPRDKKPSTLVNSFLLLSILFLLIYYIIPAAFTLPLNFDSNDYRLSRVGYWLQEGHVWQFPTNDIRQIIMPVNYDILSVWITSFFHKGYPLVHLISYFGGLLVCASIYAFCTILHFPMQWRLAAIVFWLGIPNSATQLLTSQTDLLTTGCLMAGLVFLYQAVKHKRFFSYGLAGAGIGLAVGAKSTVFLWGPGLLFFTLCLFLLRMRDWHWPNLIKGISLLITVFLLLGSFTYLQNQVRFGNFLGPTKVVASIQDSRQPLVRTEAGKKPMKRQSFVNLRAKAYLWQIFEPSSNLRVIQPITNRLFVGLEQDIKATNKNVKSSFVGMFNQGTSWLRSVKMSEDYVSFGSVSFILLLAGGLLALYRTVFTRDFQSVAVFVVFVAVLLYMVFFCYYVGWTVHRFRYAVLLTPFMAVVSTYFLFIISSNSFFRISYLTLFISTVLLVYQFAMSVNVATNSRAHGWRSFWSPDRIYSYEFYWKDIRLLTEQLAGRSKRIGLFLSKGSWKSMFFRNGTNIKSFYIARENTLNANYDFFNHYNIDALVTKRLSSVRVDDSFKLVRSKRDTHQALIKTGLNIKNSSWSVKRGVWSDGWASTRGKVFIGNWDSEVFSFKVCNTTPITQNISFKTSVNNLKTVFKPDVCKEMKIEVARQDYIKWSVNPGYYPWKQNDSADRRPLGFKISLPDNKKGSNNDI